MREEKKQMLSLTGSTDKPLNNNPNPTSLPFNLPTDFEISSGNLRTNEELISLKLSGTFGNGQLLKLTEIVTENPKLRSLNLSCYRSEFNKYNYGAPIFNVTIDAYRKKHRKILEAENHQFFSSIENHTNLAALHLSKFFLFREKCLQNYQYLDIESYNWVEYPITIDTKNLFKISNKLEILNLSHNYGCFNLSNSSRLEEFQQLLSRLQKIKILTLNNTSLNNKVTEILSNYLKENRTLYYLALENNNITDEGGNHLLNSLTNKRYFRTIKHNSTLIVLKLAGNTISNSILTKIQNCIERNKANCKELKAAIYIDDFQMVQRILKTTYNSKSTAPDGKKSEFPGYSSLMFAARENKPNAVKALLPYTKNLEAKALEPALKVDISKTALQIAKIRGNIEVAKIIQLAMAFDRPSNLISLSLELKQKLVEHEKMMKKNNKSILYHSPKKTIGTVLILLISGFVMLTPLRNLLSNRNYNYSLSDRLISTDALLFFIGQALLIIAYKLGILDFEVFKLQKRFESLQILVKNVTQAQDQLINTMKPVILKYRRKELFLKHRDELLRKDNRLLEFHVEFYHQISNAWFACKVMSSNLINLDAIRKKTTPEVAADIAAGITSVISPRAGIIVKAVKSAYGGFVGYKVAQAVNTLVRTFGRSEKAESLFENMAFYETLKRKKNILGKENRNMQAFAKSACEKILVDILCGSRIPVLNERSEFSYERGQHVTPAFLIQPAPSLFRMASSVIPGVADGVKGQILEAINRP